MLEKDVKKTPQTKSELTFLSSAQIQDIHWRKIFKDKKREEKEGWPRRGRIWA